MNRNIWLLVCLVVGFGGSFSDGFLLETGNGGLTEVLATALGASSPTGNAANLVQFGVNLAIGGLAAAILFILPLALLDGFAAQSAIAALRVYLEDDPKKRKKITRDELSAMLSGSGPLKHAAKNYIASLVLNSKAVSPPANAGIVGSILSPQSFFSTTLLVNRALHLWFFNGLAFALAGSGATFAFLIAASSGAEPGPLTSSYLALSANAAAAIIILILVGLPGTLRRHQVERLQSCLEELFPSDPWAGRVNDLSTAATASLEEIAEAVRKARTEVVKAVNLAARSTGSTVEASLEKWRGDLTEAVEQSLKVPMSALAGNQTKSVQKLVDSTLKSIKTGLQSPIEKQVGNLEKSVKSTSRVVAQTEKAFEKANADLSRNLAAHEKALSKDFARYTDGLKKNLDGQALAVTRLDELNEAVAASLDGMKPLLQRIAAGQEQLLSAIEDEGTAAQVINTSSKELGAAAKASRESVEQFVALAENLKAVSVALQKAGKSATSADRDTARNEDRPAELSQAIRDLKASSERRSLPKL